MKIYVDELPQCCGKCEFTNYGQQKYCALTTWRVLADPRDRNDPDYEPNEGLYSRHEACPLLSLADHDKAHDKAFEAVKKLGSEWKHRAQVAEIAFELFLKENEGYIADPFVDKFYKQAEEELKEWKNDIE
jgi:hypothetical protein